MNCRMGIRHEWFQTEQYVTVTIFAKGLSSDQVEVNLTIALTEMFGRYSTPAHMFTTNTS